MAIFDEKEILKSPEEIQAMLQKTRSRKLVLDENTVIKMNCSHRNLAGNRMVKPRIIKVTDGKGGFVDKKVLECALCHSIIEQVTEAEYKQLKILVPQMVEKIINYVKVFDKKWNEEERTFCVMTQYLVMNLMMIFESTIVEARKKNNNDGNKTKKTVTSQSLFNAGRY